MIRNKNKRAIKEMVLKVQTCIRQLLLMLLVSTLCKAKYSKLKDNLALEMFIKNHKNCVISPLMIRFPLCKLASVAQGQAKSDLLSLLDMKPKELENCYIEFKKIVEGLKNIDFLNINKIIVNYTDEFNPKFMSNSINYGVRVDKVGYNYPDLAVSFINRWVDKATYKRVTDLLVPGDLNNKTSMVIINAAYLKVTWEFPFHIKSTKEKKFHHPAGRVSVVPMMSKTEACLYLNDEISRAQYITMKLASFGLTMTVIIPQTVKGLPELLHRFLNEPAYLSGVRKKMKFKITKITLPRFKIKSDLDLKEYLQKIGASIIFNETSSDLNAILKDNIINKNMYVSKMKQKNFIDVDEMGIFRQLPRDMYDEIARPGTATNEVVFDHPFYFTVNIENHLSDKNYIYNMFQGVYYGPEE